MGMHVFIYSLPERQKGYNSTTVTNIYYIIVIILTNIMHYLLTYLPTVPTYRCIIYLPVHALPTWISIYIYIYISYLSIHINYLPTYLYSLVLQITYLPTHTLPTYLYMYYLSTDTCITNLPIRITYRHHACRW